MIFIYFQKLIFVVIFLSCGSSFFKPINQKTLPHRVLEKERTLLYRTRAIWKENWRQQYKVRRFKSIVGFAMVQKSRNCLEQ